MEVENARNTTGDAFVVYREFTARAYLEYEADGRLCPRVFLCDAHSFLLHRKQIKTVTAFVIGAASAFMFESHYLCFAFMIIPLLYFATQKRWYAGHLLSVAAGIITVYFFLQLGKIPVGIFPPDTDRLFSGFYMFSAPWGPDMLRLLSGQWLYEYTPELQWWAWIPLIITVIILVKAYQPMTPNRFLITSVLVFSAGLYAFFQPFPLRYFIPVLWTLMFVLPLSFEGVRGYKFTAPVLALIILPFTTSFYHTHLDDYLPSDDPNKESMIRSLVSAHQEDGYTAVFCEEETLSYLFNFYAGGVVHYRAKNMYSRFQRDWYDGQMALEAGEKTALYSELPRIENLYGKPISAKLFFYETADRAMLDAAGFQFEDK
jgi:hypothetical protein